MIGPPPNRLFLQAVGDESFDRWPTCPLAGDKFTIDIPLAVIGEDQPITRVAVEDFELFIRCHEFPKKVIRHLLPWQARYLSKKIENGSVGLGILPPTDSLCSIGLLGRIASDPPRFQGLR